MTMTDTPTPLNRLGRLMIDQPLLPLIGLLILLVAILAILNPGVLSMFWAGNTIKIAIPLAMLAACQTLTMLTGGIDLSVGTVATIAAYLTATLAPMIGVPPAIAIALAAAVVIGLVNGFGIAVCRVHPLIMTLGTALIGLVGPAARACGFSRDIRNDLPLGVYCFNSVPVSTWHSGDVFARAYVRWLEIQQSVKFIQDRLAAFPGGPVQAAVGPLEPNRLIVAMVEAWRGEICHVALTDGAGRFRRYKIVDPSFHNWMGLAMALRGQAVSDFPICNKSFNLSYCGFDL